MKPFSSQLLSHPFQVLLLGTMLAFPFCSGGNILVVPMDGSHWLNMNSLIKALHERGHSITILRSSRSWYVKEQAEHYTSLTIPVSGGFNADFVHPLIMRIMEAQRSGSSLLNFIGLQTELFEALVKSHQVMCEMASNLMGDRALIRTLNESQFDIVLTDPTIGTGVILGHYLRLPLVYNVRWITTGEGHFAIAPSPLSYVPMTGLGLTDRMNFIERTKNFLFYLVYDLNCKLRLNAQYQAICDRFFSPKVDFYELLQAGDIWLMRVDFVFEFPRPTMPNQVYVGGFHCTPAKPLPEDLERFVQSSGEYGVIIMSLGTFVKELPADISEEVAFAFAQLPQKVIWRHAGQRPPSLGNNTLLVDWMPQNDLLGHPKVKLFVAHGGTNGVQETMYHGVPVIGLPLFSDQYDNLLRLQNRGAAKILTIGSLDRSIFLQALQEVLNDPSYMTNMQRLSRLHLDQPMKPLDRALFWTEFVMRHKGAGHLRTESYKLPWYAYHSLDVVLFLLTAPLSVTILMALLVKWMCVRVCCRGLKRKTD